MMNKTLLVLSALTLTANAHAATWQCPFPIAVGKPAPHIEITPIKYGKTWAYSFEQDDGPATTLTVTQPLLAKYQWNDAPPGVTGGINRPFVGTAAIILGSLNTGNSTGLDFKQIALLKKSGWDIVNHSYWHTGNHWDPSQYLKPADFARELFWSQTIFAETIGNGRGATHFVYPNGDPYYKPYLTTYGLRSSSRVGGSSAHNLSDSKYDPLDLPRTYLDESVWSQSNNPLQDFPEKPMPNDFLIDFTHNIDGDPQSPNNKRWVTRLNHIAGTWGAQGDNSMWVAPTDEVVNYATAARAAKVIIKGGKLTVNLPDTIPGSALTLKISGLSTLPKGWKVPLGATIYRKGNTVWLTTPMIGKPGSPLPTPPVRRIYSGPIKNLTWAQPVAIAGIRIRQFGPGAKDFVLKIDAITPDGKIESLLPGGEAPLREVWGGWNLYPVVPDRPAIRAKELRITPGKDLNEMEVWVISAPDNAP